MWVWWRLVLVKMEEREAEHASRISKPKSKPSLPHNPSHILGADPNTTPHASQKPLKNIIGLKDSGGNVQKLAIIRENTPENFQLLAGSFGFLLPALAVGAVGGVCAMANAFPEECCELMRLWNQGNLEGAKKLQTKLAEINFAVTAKLGVPAMKTAMVWRGFAGERHVRMPLLPLTKAEEGVLENLFKKAGKEVFVWEESRVENVMTADCLR